MAETEEQLTEKRVWDLPTRLFHWMLVVTVSVGWWLGDNLSFNNIDWHFYLGYTTGGLIVFRIIWGFVGPGPSRLLPLFQSPKAVLTYGKTLSQRQPSGTAGHNPMGGYSVLLILATIAVQVSTGLFSEADDLFSEGPLASYASRDVILLCNYIHEIASEVLLVLIGLHIAVILFYRFWKRENLVTAMVTGRKAIKKTDTPSEISVDQS